MKRKISLGFFVLFLGQAKNEKPFQLEEKGSFLEFP
jgi:hypothetical protein